MSSTTLSKVIESQRPVLDDLIGVYKNGGRPIPWFGAGSSVPYGYPSWSAFLNSLPCNKREADRIARNLTLGKYEQAADLAYKALGKTQFESSFGSTFAVPGTLPTNSTVLTEGIRLMNGLAVTTNYENVLHDQLEAYFGLSPRRVDVLDSWLVNATSSDTLAVWRVHGPADNHEQRVLLSHEYASRYGNRRWSWQKETPLETYLNILFQQRVVFMGSSLATDRTMAAMLRWASSAPASLYSFAFLESSREKGEDPSRLAYLSDRHIRPILYPHGAHHVLPGLVQYVADAVESFLERGFLKNLRGLSIQSRASKGEVLKTSTPLRPHIDLTHHFDDQALKEGSDWNQVRNELDKFLTLNPCDGPLCLDLSTHLCVAYHLGSSFPDRGTRAASLLHRFKGTTVIWHLNDERRGRPYKIESRGGAAGGPETAIIVVSKVSSADQAVAKARTIPNVGLILVVRPDDGDDGIVAGGHHANDIAEQTVQAFKESVPHEHRGALKHLFIAGPAGLAFALGQRSIHLGRVQLYEYVSALGSYVPAFESKL